MKAKETTLLPSAIEQKEIVYRDRFKKIRRIRAWFDGFSKEYFVADFGEKAAVLALRHGKILLARQYRLFINGLSYEIPGGKVDKDEHPRDAACRECLEETGVKCLNLKPLISYNPDLEYTKNYTSVFYTEDVEEVSEGASQQRVWIPFNDCIDMIFTEKISDSLSIISILAYHTLLNKV